MIDSLYSSFVMDRLTEAVKTAMFNFLGHANWSKEQVDLVADRVREALDLEGIYREMLIESASTYIQADLSLEELDIWVEEMVTQLEGSGLM